MHFSFRSSVLSVQATRDVFTGCVHWMYSLDVFVERDVLVVFAFANLIRRGPLRMCAMQLTYWLCFER